MKILILFYLLTSLTCYSQIENQDTTETLIIDGIGYGNFKLDNLKLSEVVKKLGDNYQEIKHGSYSIEIDYEEIGVSFLYYQGYSEGDKTIFGINFKAPFKGQTIKGIVLNQTTMQDVVEAYGEPDWSSCDNCTYWTSDYDGIEFLVERDMSLPHYPLNEAVHLEKVIKEIFIFNPELFD